MLEMRVMERSQRQPGEPVEAKWRRAERAMGTVMAAVRDGGGVGRLACRKRRRWSWDRSALVPSLPRPRRDPIGVDGREVI